MSSSPEAAKKSKQTADSSAETPAAPHDGAKPADDKTAATKTEGEHGGPKGPDPTRFGDWERKGRCIDF